MQNAQTYNATASSVYRLATKTKTGQIIAFGPLMPRNVAEKKRQDMARLVPAYPVYVINTASA